MEQPNLLITGATGNVGAEVVRLLRQQGHAVRIAVREIPEERDAPDPLVVPVLFDFLRPETWPAAVGGIERLFLVRPPAISDTKKHINPMLEVARQAGVKHVVFLSLLGAEKNAVVPHHRVETYLQSSNLAYTFLRASFFMQNLSTTHRQEIRDESVIAVPAGSGKTSFIDARDIAAVGVRALTEPGHENKAYSLTGSEALDYDQVAAILAECLGRRITYVRPSLIAFARRMRKQGHPLGFIVVTAAIYTTARLGLADRTTLDTAHLLSREPISMRQFAADYADTWMCP